MQASPSPELSPAVLALVRATLEQVWADAPRLFSDLHDAVASSAPAALVSDPALAAEIERSNVAILAAWLQANIERPGQPIDPVLTPDTLDIVRDVARRGLEDSTYNYFRVGLGVASQHVLAAAFTRSADPEVLQAALHLMLGSAGAYIDRSVAALREVIQAEHAARAARTRSSRLEIATELIEARDVVDHASASARLGFELDRPLLACVLWADPSTGPGSDGLLDMARQLAQACGARSQLAVAASAASVWAWIPAGQIPEVAGLRAVVARAPGVRVAVGSIGSGVAGFRRGHLDALQTQRLMHRLGPSVGLSTFAEVRVVALAGADEPAAAEFVATVLGGLATAGPELRSTLRAVIASGFDTARVAEQFGLHRNTVLGRVRRAENLLPADAPPRWIDIGLALELDAWLASGLGTVAPRSSRRTRTTATRSQ